VANEVANEVATAAATAAGTPSWASNSTVDASFTPILPGRFDVKPPVPESGSMPIAARSAGLGRSGQGHQRQTQER
jgi:hypothetical protein